MADTTYSTRPAEPARPVIRRIGMEDLRIALRQGWDDYRAKRGEMIFLGLIYPVVGLVASAMFSNSDLLPLLFPMAAGLALLGPALASGFYELARRRDAGEDPHWSCTLEVFKTPPFAALAGLSGLVFALFGLWLFTAWGIYTAVFGSEPMRVSTVWPKLFSTAQGWTLILVGNLVGALFSLVALALSAVSFPMVVDRKAGPVTAAETSLRVARANPGTVLAWGLIVAGLLVLGSIPLFVGLAVVLPVLGYATWHLYTRAVER